jgi:hypothetical protein
MAFKTAGRINLPKFFFLGISRRRYLLKNKYAQMNTLFFVGSRISCIDTVPFFLIINAFQDLFHILFKRNIEAAQ